MLGKSLQGQASVGDKGQCIPQSEFSKYYCPVTRRLRAVLSPEKPEAAAATIEPSARYTKHIGYNEVLEYALHDDEVTRHLL